MDALVHVKKKTGAGERGEATDGEPAPTTSLWGMLYAEDAEAHRHIQRRGSRSGVLPSKRVRISRRERQSQSRPVHRGREAHTNAWCSFRRYTLELYGRPSAPLELKTRMLRVEVLETMLYDCVTWSPRTCHYDTLRRAHHQLPDSLHWLVKEQWHRPPDFLSGHAHEDGK